MAIDQEESGSPFPSYLTSADNHNLGNNGSSWFSLKGIGESISNAPSFAAVSILSGANSFYNTGVKLANLFGAGIEEKKTSALISELDSDLGKYYQQNQASADLMGFLVGSLIPGVAGVKILNAGQKALVAANEGIVGTNLGLALGLRATKIDAYVAAASKEISAGQAIFTTLSGNATKAISAGVYQNVLEGIAFETMVQATMQASPILSQQDKSDIVWNIATGGLIGGAVGGAFSSASIYGKITKAVKDIRQEVQAFGSRELQQEINSPANRIIVDAYDLERGPTFDPGDPLYTQKLQALEQRQNRINLDIRANTGRLVKGEDKLLARMVADTNIGASAEDLAGRYIDTSEITRLRNPTKVEAAIKKRAASGAVPDENLQIHYWKLTGEDAGMVLADEPVVFNLADIVSETANKSTRQAVLDAVAAEKFSIKKFWDATKVSLADAKGHLEAEKRYIWASRLVELPDDVKIHMADIPLLETALRLEKTNIKLVDMKGQVLFENFSSVEELQRYVISAKRDTQRLLQEEALKQGRVAELIPGESGRNPYSQLWVNEKIGKITNSRLKNMEETAVTSPDIDYFAYQTAKKDYAKFQEARGLKPVDGEEQELFFMPQWAKVTKVVSDKKINGHVVDAITLIKAKYKVAEEAMDRAAAMTLKEFTPQVVKFTEQDLAKVDPLGTGAGFLAGNNPGYNDPGSKAALLGSVVQRATAKFKEVFSTETSGVLVNLGRNQEAVIEWGSLNQKVSRTAKQWLARSSDDMEELTSRGLLAKEVIDPETGTFASKYLGYTEADLISDGLFIPVVKNETWDLVNAHISAEGKRTVARNARSAAAGKSLSLDAEVFRPIRPDPRDYKFFAFVKDPKVTGQGHTSMIFAEDAQKLEALINKARQARPDLDIYYKQDTAEFRQARQTYEYARDLSENYLDSSLKSKGIYSDYFLSTDPQKVIDQFVNYHSKQIDIEVREAVRASNQAAFDWLEDQAKAYSRSETSRFGGNFEKLEREGKNPYLSYIKTALNLSRANENPLWYSANKVLDDAVSKAVGKFQELWGGAKTSITEEKLAELNGFLQKYGLNTGYYDAATELLVNHTAPKNELSKFIRGANAVLSRITLGLDPLNALNNAIGANILRGTELKQITNAIKEGDQEIAGALAKLGKVDVTGQGDLVLAPAKMIANSMNRYFKLIMASEKSEPQLKALRQFYKDNGFIRDLSEQFRDIIDDFTLVGDEGPKVLQSRLQSAIQKSSALAEKGETWTGNKLAEEMNRFISADVMKQLTDLARKAGLMDEKEALTYINTFVNRVEGNVIASQRPFIFQGPVGQAIGLFQSYQFNLIQQMFRYVSEGSKKDAAMLLGLQGTFYGIQGLPAFQAINQHIIGTASGNTNHVDAYDAIYGIAGKNLGDLLTYGLASNILQTNLYSRGDINPRHLTVVPTALQDVPFISAFTKFASSLKETFKKISAGGDVWQSVLQGIEHNGISRPLAGLAQTLQVTAVGSPMSTSSRGDILFTNDLMSLATLSRLAGGRPLDEAIINDAVFRIHSYQQYDRRKMNLLSEAIKTQAVGSGAVDGMAWDQFAAKYAEAGGRQVNFNAYMIDKIKQANVSQSEKIIQQLQNPFAQKVQLLMGSPED